MNFRFRTLMKLVGCLLMIVGISMFPSMLCAAVQGQTRLSLIFLSCGILTGTGGAILFRVIHPSRKRLTIRDGYLSAILAWILCSLAAMTPYLFSGVTRNIWDAFFESVADFTTTGATVLKIHMPDALILWKAICHWMGGMGILIFMISILPMLGTGGQRIATAESPGPELLKLKPRMQDYSIVLYLIYVILTAAEWLLLWLGSKMNAFEALVNSLGSISTAGLFLHPDGIGYYHSLYVELIISIFTILSSINFVCYLHLAQRDFKNLFKNMELRIFLCMIAIGTLIVTVALRCSGTFHSIGSALRHAFFQVTAFATTSGFSMDNYNRWPTLCLAVFFLLLLIGGCAASTAGGIKVIRVGVMIKLIIRGFYRRRHPRAVRAVRLGETVISAQLASAVTSFILIYGVTFFLSAIILSLQGMDMTTTLSTTAGLMSTTGLNIGSTPIGYLGMYHPVLKLFMSLLMITGRLEMVAVLLLFFPSFWSPDRLQINR